MLRGYDKDFKILSNINLSELNVLMALRAYYGDLVVDVFEIKKDNEDNENK